MAAPRPRTTRQTTPRGKPGRRALRLRGHRQGLIALLACTVAVASIAGGMAWVFGTASGAARIGGPFALIDENSRPVTDRDFRGRYMLVYFGYTSCPDVCPTTLTDIAAALGTLGAKASRVQPIFVTVDPARDTPAVLRHYVDAIDPNLVALTGSPAAVAATLQTFRVHSQIAPMAGHPNDYTVDHTAVLYLMGPTGRLIAPIRADEPADQMARDIAGHIT